MVKLSIFNESAIALSADGICAVQRPVHIFRKFIWPSRVMTRVAGRPIFMGA
jgi:hypothetical protein